MNSSKSGENTFPVFGSEIQPRDRGLTVAICVCLAAAVWSVFGQTLLFDFINYDDDRYVYGNPAITGGLSLHAIVRIFTPENSPDGWFPLTDLSHLLDWQLYGSIAGGHHLTNVLLHTASVILLFLILRNMTGALWRSAFVAVVFAVHPLQVESVAWVTERKDVLSGLFFMLTLWMWLRYAQKRSREEGRESHAGSPFLALNPRHWTLDYYLALVFFALGLLSKSMLATLPCVLLLLDYWPLDRLPPSVPSAPRPRFHAFVALILEKVPFLLLSGAASVATVLTQKGVISVAEGYTFPWRVGNALMAYVDYLGHWIYPVGLALVYPHPPKHLSDWRVGLSALALLAISTGAFTARRKHPYVLVGWLWYLGMLLPVIDIVQASQAARADRYTYLPQIALGILVAWGVVDLWGSWRYRRTVLGSATAAIIAGLLVLSYRQTSYWKNSATLWTHALACTRGNFVAHCFLGIALDKQGKLDEAIQQYEQALQFKPDYVEVHYNLGVVLAKEGKYGEAIQQYERALQLEPDVAEIHVNLGNVLAEQGKLDEAIQQYEQALQLKQDAPLAESNLGEALLRQGPVQQSVAGYEAAIKLRPNNVAFLNNFAWLLATSPDAHIRNGQKAVQLAERACQLTGYQKPQLIGTLAAAYAEVGRFDDAVALSEKVHDLALALGQQTLALKDQELMQLFKTHQPYREKVAKSE